jgi:hypothetical protein
MKSVRSILFAFTAVLLMATAAQAQQPKVKANIPFDFVVGDRAYPAGEYTVQRLSNLGGTIRIENTREASAAGNVLTNPCVSLTPSETTKLVFRRMGDNHYFLYQVWIQGRDSGRELVKSHGEIRLAQNHEEGELIIVAANISH